LEVFGDFGVRDKAVSSLVERSESPIHPRPRESNVISEFDSGNVIELADIPDIQIALRQCFLKFEFALRGDT